MWRWRTRRGIPRPRRRRRALGCLLWLVGLIILLIVLATLFGGFQKGTKASGIHALIPVSAHPAQQRGPHHLRAVDP